MKRIRLLLAAVALLCSVGVWAQTSPTNGVVVAPGDYYIYNLGSEMYVSKGSSHGTHATVDGAGCVVTISGTTDAYALHFDGIAAEKFLGDAGWTDNATSSYTWSFESETVDGYSNVYKIKDNAKDKYLYWFAGSGVDWGNEVMVDDMPSTLPNGCYILIPKATRESIASASTSNIVDVTYLLTDPDIEASVNSLKWSGSFKRQNSAHTGYSGNYLEKWVDSANALGDVSAYQTLSLPAGTYRLTMAATAERQNQSIEITGAYIYAGDQQTAVSSTNTYTVDFTTNGAPIQIGMKTVSTNANWVNFDKVRLYCLGLDYSNAIISGVDYTTMGSAPTGGHTYVLYNETGKFLYNDGVTPKISSTNASFYTLETTGDEFYIRSDAGLLYKQSNSNWNTWADGVYGDVAKWKATLSDGKYTLQNHNKAADTYFFAPNSNGEGVQCYSDKTSLTGWYFIDVTDKNYAVSLLYALQQAKASVYTPAAESDAKEALGEALNDIYLNYVLAESFTSTTYDEGEAAIQAAIDAYWSARFAAVDGREGGEDITSWITNPTPTSNGDGWTFSTTSGRTFDSGNNNAEFWNQGAASLSQTINLPAGYYRLTAVALTRTGMSAPLAVTGATSGSLNSMNISTVGSGTVNGRGGANTWFNAGYGVNELDFYVPTKQDVTISLTTDNTTNDHWMVWRSFQLTAVGSEEGNLLNLEQYLDNAALTRANAAKNDATYTHVTGTERTNLENAISALENYSGTGTTAEKVAARKALKYALVSPYNAYYQTSVKNAYDEYYYENETATRLDADASGVSVPTTAAEATTAAHAINVINYNKFVAAEYADVSGTALGAWTDNNVTQRTAQHWSGNASEPYFEMNTGYSDGTWSMSRQQSINLAAGSYVLRVAARVTGSAEAQLSVTVGSGDPIVTYSGHHGDSGLGITTSGEACYISHDTDESKVYTNGNNGRGFEWRYIPFSLNSDGDVTLKFYAENTSGNLYQYVSFCDLGIWTDPKVAARTELLTAINNATAALRPANEGTGIFQYPVGAGATLTTAITTAQSVYDNDDAVLSEINTATTAMTTAQTTYEGSLNAPTTGKRYRLILQDKGALTFQTASTEGNYGLPFMTAGDYMAQDFVLTKVSGNMYFMSFQGFDGNVHYICTRAAYGEGGTGTAGIRTTTTMGDLLPIIIEPTNTAGVFNMLNTANDKAKLGSNGGDFYTDNAYTSWTIEEASQAEVTVSCKAGKFGTIIFPFTPNVTEGFDDIKFYQFASSDNDGVRVNEVEKTSLVANMPYLVKNTGSENFSKTLTGWGIAAEDSYNSSEDDVHLTGVYTDANVPENSYVLQDQGQGQKFYKVTGTFPATPYRVFLVDNSGNEARFFNLFIEGEGVTNGIDRLTGITEQITGVIYDLQGRKVQKPGRGMYIINGKKVVIK